MGKKVREYKSGDFIFAKVKGYPAWPARVQRMNGKKYFVYFYGTGETANLPPNMIFDYAENKDKFLTKTVKRRDFNDGVKQIEHDFANNVPLEQVIGAIAEAPADAANDTANDTANETADESAMDTTAADDTVDESTPNTTQNDTAIEDSDEAGPLVIDEGKKGKKGKPDAKTPAKELPKGKDPKTPRGKAKKDDANDDEAKKDEEIISRSGRKIRPKRYIDEQTEENTTLPSPAPKKRRGTSPAQDKDGDKEKEKAEPAKPAAKLYNSVTQSELEDLKEPFKQDKQTLTINTQVETEQSTSKIVPKFGKSKTKSNNNLKSNTKKFSPPTGTEEPPVFSDFDNIKYPLYDNNLIYNELTLIPETIDTQLLPNKSISKENVANDLENNCKKIENSLSGLILGSFNVLNGEEISPQTTQNTPEEKLNVVQLQSNLSQSSVASLKIYKDLDAKSFVSKSLDDHEIPDGVDFLNLFNNNVVKHNFQPVAMSIENGDIGFNTHYSEFVKNFYVEDVDNDETENTRGIIMKMYQKENKLSAKKIKK